MEQLASAAGVVLPGLDNAPANRPAPHVRDRRRARAWHEAVGRLTGHRLEHATTPAEAVQVERDHAKEVEAGPAFAKVRRRSYDDTPPACTDRNELVRILALFGQLEIEMHRRDRAWADHEGRRIKRTIARTVRPVLAVLIGLAKTHDQVFPSLERIARLAGCCPRTVTSALSTLERAGLVARHRRRKAVVTPYGKRLVQDTSAYVLILPTETAGQIATRLDKGEAPPSRPRHQKAKIAELFDDPSGETEKTGTTEVAKQEPRVPLPPYRPAQHDWRARERAFLQMIVASGRVISE